MRHSLVLAFITASALGLFAQAPTAPDLSPPSA